MARLINVIHKPHLATYIACDDSKYRCCIMCKYQAVIEDDRGKLYVVSLLNEDDINELNLEAAIRIKLTNKGIISHSCERISLSPD